ncbi:acyloxyacyl hydrolase [Pedobacter insulae]|uniref:Lipid A 3-O-deacylase (PagL) n=1 Tax=Pedobacter insulae TaxID=414048 RepID=A0A1I2ZVF1_9SPHI|nr:acyloxyacyl hydrolase [Pedobacter insulae]SFH41778.1 Lipid A 3-O-deacylase (PagL) [Pedobacter insulae]
MSLQTLSSYLMPSCFALMLLPNKHQAQGLGNALEFNTQLSIQVFSDGANKIAGYATGKSLAYHFSLLNDLNLKGIDVVFNYKDLSKIHVVEKLEPGEFGNMFALIGMLNFSMGNRRLRLVLSPGMGISYLAKTWYTHSNPITSSHLNFSPTANLKLSLGLNAYKAILAGLSIAHYSNAAMRVPNNGLNIVDFNLGVKKYLIQHKPIKLVQYENPDFNKHNLELGVNIGYRGVFYQKRNLYKSGVFFGYKYNFNPSFGLSTGMDAVYYYSVFDSKRYTATYQSKATSLTSWRVGVGAGPTISIRRLSLTAIYGRYLYFNSYWPIYTYWNGSVKYKANNWLAIQAKLYGHREEVDFLGIGVLFNWAL